MARQQNPRAGETAEEKDRVPMVLEALPAEGAEPAELPTQDALVYTVPGLAVSMPTALGPGRYLPVFLSERQRDAALVRPPKNASSLPLNREVDCRRMQDSSLSCVHASGPAAVCREFVLEWRRQNNIMPLNGGLQPWVCPCICSCRGLVSVLPQAYRGNAAAGWTTPACVPRVHDCLMRPGRDVPLLP